MLRDCISYFKSSLYQEFILKRTLLRIKKLELATAFLTYRNGYFWYLASHQREFDAIKQWAKYQQTFYIRYILQDARKQKADKARMAEVFAHMGSVVLGVWFRM